MTTTAAPVLPTAPDLAAIAAQRKTILTQAFRNHGAELTRGKVGGVSVERMVWRRPDSTTYRIDYLCLGGAQLVITGDMGEAIFLAGAHSLRWWADCDLGYFASKCVASPVGRLYRAWDSDRALANAVRFFESAEETGLRPEAAGEFAARDGWRSLARQDEWLAWMAEHAVATFGTLDADMAQWGDGIDLQCEALLMGLKAAFRFLEPPHVEA